MLHPRHLALFASLLPACGPTLYVPPDQHPDELGADVFVGEDFDPTMLQSYVVDVQSGFFAEPPLVGELYKDEIDDFLLSVSDLADEHAIALRVGLADDPHRRPPVQNRCIETVELPAVDWSANPDWHAAAGATRLNVDGFEAEILELELSGSFAGNGGSVEDLTLVGVVDTRHLVELVEAGADDDTLCVMAADFGTSCQPCADGTGSYCLPLRVEGLTGYPTSDPVAPVTAADVAANPACG